MCFVAVANRGEDVISDEILVDSIESSSVGGGVAEVCATPRLVYDSFLFFEKCMHVYVRTTYNQVYPAKVKAPPGGELSGWT